MVKNGLRCLVICLAYFINCGKFKSLLFSALEAEVVIGVLPVVVLVPKMVPFITLFTLNPLQPVHIGIVIGALVDLETKIAVLVIFEVFTTGFTNIYFLFVGQLHFAQTDRLFWIKGKLRCAELEVVALSDDWRYVFEKRGILTWRFYCVGR
jgi:hypothetical protein